MVRSVDSLLRAGDVGLGLGPPALAHGQQSRGKPSDQVTSRPGRRSQRHSQPPDAGPPVPDRTSPNASSAESSRHVAMRRAKDDRFSRLRRECSITSRFPQLRSRQLPAQVAAADEPDEVPGLRRRRLRLLSLGQTSTVAREDAGRHLRSERMHESLCRPACPRKADRVFPARAGPDGTPSTPRDCRQSGHGQRVLRAVRVLRREPYALRASSTVVVARLV